MCLAVVGKVVSVRDGEGEVVIDGKSRTVSFVALPDAEPGQQVLVSLGMAVELLSEQEARELQSVWDAIAQIEPVAKESSE